MDRDEWNQRYAEAGLVWSAEPNQFVAAEIAPLPPGRALDLGAGEGRNAVWLARQGWTVTAVDFSDVALAKAAEQASAAGVEIATECADVADYLPEAAAYDLVLLCYLHLPAALRRETHRRAAAALAPGGTLLVVGHDTTNLTEGYGGPQDAAVLFTPGDVVADLAGTGLVVQMATRARRVVATGEGDRVAIDAVVRARRPA